MNLTLLVSLKDQTEAKWSLLHEMSGRETEGKWSFSENAGVIPVGLHAVLFDQTKGHGIFVQVCAHLIDKKWPYCVVTVDVSSILVEGTCAPELQAIVEKSRVRGEMTSPKVS